MKPKFIMSSGTGWSATTPLWNTLQLDNQYMHTGLKKESEYIRKLLQNPTERFSGVVERIRKKSRWRSREEHKVRKEQTINKNLFLNQEDKDAFLKAPYTIEKYITYYKRLWESLQENNCSYQAVGDFSNANYSIPEEFCHELVGKLSEEFDVKVLMIVRDPIRRLWSEIGGFWGQKSTRQWENEKEVIESSKTAEEDWMILVNEIADTTVFTDTKSWYNGSNIESKAKSFLPFIGVPVYTEMLEEIVAEDYKGFIFDKAN